MAASVLYTNFGGMLVHEDRGGVQRTYVHDEMGNTSYLVDSSGAVTDSYDYTPYGQVSHTGSNVTPFTFIGALGYFATGMTLFTSYVRARWYSRVSGSWGSVDPIWPMEPSYAYVNGNPAMFVDPSGFLRGGLTLGPPVLIGLGPILKVLFALIWSIIGPIILAIMAAILLYACTCLALIFLTHPVCDGLGGKCHKGTSCSQAIWNLAMALLYYKIRELRNSLQCPQIAPGTYDHKGQMTLVNNRVINCLTETLISCGRDLGRIGRSIGPTIFPGGLLDWR